MRVLYISEVQWRSQASRKHHMIRRFPSDWDVVFLSPANASRGENTFALRTDAASPHVRYMSMPLPKPDSTFALVRALTAPLTAVGMHQLRGELSAFRPDVVVISYIWAAPVVASARGLGARTVYDCNDLHPDFYPLRREAAEKAFRDLVAAVDEVVASSGRLRDVCGRGVVIGNGVDLTLFTRRGGSPEPEALAASPLAGRRRLVAYVGSIDARIDFAILEAVAERLAADADAGLLCIGRVFDSARERADGLADRFPEHVLFTGLVPYDRLPAYLARSPVGIAPFVLDERTRAINPNKLYMYAAMEENIVSTPFSADVTEHSGLIRTEDDPGGFARAVMDALGDDERRRAVREAIAVPNSWDEKAASFARLLSRLASGGRADA